MARRRTTFGKLQRDLEKQAKAKAKIERRQARAAEQPASEEGQTAEADQEKILAELAALHQAFDDGEISLEDFEAKKEELTSRLRIE